MPASKAAKHTANTATPARGRGGRKRAREPAPSATTSSAENASLPASAAPTSATGATATTITTSALTEPATEGGNVQGTGNNVLDVSSASATPAGRYSAPELPFPASSSLDRESGEESNNEEEESGLVQSVTSPALPQSEDAGSVNDNAAVAQLLQQTRGAAQSIQDQLEGSISRFKMMDSQLTQLAFARQGAQQKVEQVVESRHPESYAEVVTLNVGGERFTVPVTSLLGKDNPSYFHALLGSEAAQSFAPLFKDHENSIFIDRDPSCFKYVLDYLRGYHYFNLLKEDTLRRLKVDAAYFQLPGLLSMLGDLDHEAELQFNPGPGVSPERNRLRVVYGVAIVGDVSLVTGRHTITYEVKTADYIGFGLVSEACVNTDQEFHKIPECCVYYMSGVFYTNYPYHRKEENLERIENGDFVTVKVDLEKGYVEYVLKNSRKMVSLGRARRLRFATTMKLASRVRIVPPEEVRRRLSPLHYTFDE